MRKFNNLIDVCVFLDDQFGWYCDMSGKDDAKITKHNGETETIPKKSLENVALELWESSKKNGLDEVVVYEVEQEYFSKGE